MPAQCPVPVAVKHPDFPWGILSNLSICVQGLRLTHIPPFWEQTQNRLDPSIHLIPLTLMKWFRDGHMTQGMPMRYNTKVLVLVLENVGRRSRLSSGVGWEASRELLVGVLQIPTHRGGEMRNRKRQSSWIQPCLTLPRVSPRLCRYMNQKILRFCYQQLKDS